jgi:hypothetical protein
MRGIDQFVPGGGNGREHNARTARMVAESANRAMHPFLIKPTSSSAQTKRVACVEEKPVKAETYRVKAEQCQRMASSATRDVDKIVWQQLAESWINLLEGEARLVALRSQLLGLRCDKTGLIEERGSA